MQGLASAVSGAVCRHPKSALGLAATSAAVTAYVVHTNRTIPGLGSGLRSLARGGTGPRVPECDLSALRGRFVLITGPTSGLGLRDAREFAKAGARLALVCHPSAPKDALVAALAEDRTAGAVVAWFDVDLSNTLEVRRFCERFDLGVIDVLVLNAGLVTGGSDRTPQGLDVMVAVNYVANWIVVTEMLRRGVFPGDKRREDGWVPRVIVTASEGHRFSPKLEPRNLAGTLQFAAMYGYSKLLVLSLGCELQRRLGDRAMVVEFCPGAMRTNFGKQMPFYGRYIYSLVHRLIERKPEDVAREVVRLGAVAPPASWAASRGSRCLYYNSGREDIPREDAVNEQIGARLWEATKDLVRRLDLGQCPLAPSL